MFNIKMTTKQTSFYKKTPEHKKQERDTVKAKTLQGKGDRCTKTIKIWKLNAPSAGISTCHCP